MKQGLFVKSEAWKVKGRAQQVKNKKCKNFSFFIIFFVILEMIEISICFNLLSCNTEAVAQRCFVRKVFLEIWQNSQESTCARVSFLIKLQASGV